MGSLHNARMDKRVEKALYYLEQNIKSDLSTADLVNAAGMSQYHFHRKFLAEVGDTPARTILRRKILRAAHDILIHTKLPIIEAALEYGFSSPAVFGRSFRKIIGKSPTRFRTERRAELGLSQRNKLDAARRNSRFTAKIPVRHLSRQVLEVRQTSLDPQDLNSVYQRLQNENSDGISHAIGLFVEPPFGNLKQRPHFVGYDVAVPASSARMMEIPAGYYNYFSISGPIEDQPAQKTANLKEIIEPSPYEVASTLYFERVRLGQPGTKFEYSTAERTHFAMVRKK